MRHSPSELNTWQQCRLAWDYRYGKRLTVQTGRWATASGSAIHGAIEEALNGTVTPDKMDLVAERVLGEHFIGDEDAQSKVNRYLPGVKRALSRVPKWIFGVEDWHV